MKELNYSFIHLCFQCSSCFCCEMSWCDYRDLNAPSVKAMYVSFGKLSSLITVASNTMLCVRHLPDNGQYAFFPVIALPCTTLLCVVMMLWILAITAVAQFYYVLFENVT